MKCIKLLCLTICTYIQGSPSDSVVKNPPANIGHVGLVPGSEISPGVGTGNPL